MTAKTVCSALGACVLDCSSNSRSECRFLCCSKVPRRRFEIRVYRCPSVVEKHVLYHGRSTGTPSHQGVPSRFKMFQTVPSLFQEKKIVYFKSSFPESGSEVRDFASLCQLMPGCVSLCQPLRGYSPKPGCPIRRASLLSASRLPRHSGRPKPAKSRPFQAYAR